MIGALLDSGAMFDLIVALPVLLGGVVYAARKEKD